MYRFVVVRRDSVVYFPSMETNLTGILAVEKPIQPRQGFGDRRMFASPGMIERRNFLLKRIRLFLSN
jgi:hypothetical protein